MSMVENLCKTASEIKYDVQKLSTELKNRALLTAAAQRVGRTIPDAGSRAEGPCPRAAAPWTAPQTLPCRYAQGARP